MSEGLGTITKAYRMNIKHPVYAILTKDDTSGVTYGPVKSFGESQTVDISPKVASGELYGDGVLKDSTNKIIGYDLTTAITKMQQDVRADLFGHKFTANGEMIISEDDVSKTFAFGYEVEQSNGHKECVWLLKCKAQPYAYNVQQSEGTSTKYSNDSIKLSSMSREFDGRFQLIGDTSNSTFTQERAASFFDVVPTTITEATVPIPEEEEEGGDEE